MQCTEFESLLADALGDELAADRRPAFEAHLSECERCRHEYESAAGAVQTLRSLPATPTVPIERIGDRLVIGGRTQADSPSRRLLAAAPLRIAAAIALAFASGYLLHAARTPANATKVSPRLFEHRPGGDVVATAPRLESVLADTMARNPTGSPLANYMSAILGGPRTH